MATPQTKRIVRCSRFFLKKNPFFFFPPILLLLAHLLVCTVSTREWLSHVVQLVGQDMGSERLASVFWGRVRTWIMIRVDISIILTTYQYPAWQKWSLVSFPTSMVISDLFGTFHTKGTQGFWATGCGKPSNQSEEFAQWKYLRRILSRMCVPCFDNTVGNTLITILVSFFFRQSILLLCLIYVQQQGVTKFMNTWPNEPAFRALLANKKCCCE